jgi:Ca-activated chloride channel homolog
LTFEHPVWLLLIALALPLSWAGARWFSSMGRLRRWSAILTRVVLISLISAMLAGASSVRKTGKLAVIGIIDVSDSVRLFGKSAGDDSDPVAAARQFLISAQPDRSADDLLGVVVFGGRAAAIAVPTRADLSDRPFDIRLAEGSDLASAIRYAAALIPPDAAGRLVIISDGVQTRGDAAAAARELAGRSLPIDILPVQLGADREVMVESVDTPPRAAEGATIAVRVAIRSVGPAQGTLYLTRENEPLDINGAESGTGRHLTLGPGHHVEVVSVPLPPGRVHRFEAVFEADGRGAEGGDTRTENNRASSMTATPGKGSVLLLDGVSGPGAPGGGGILAQTLREAGINVTVIAPEACPDDLLVLQAYDLIILENVPAESISPVAQRALVAHVKDMGGGLVMVGGPDSFGAGGWKGSEVEPILPVKLDLPEKLIQPDAAVVIVMDNSGSMGRPVMGSILSQQEIANQSAALAVRTLDKKDLISIIVFNSVASVVVPLTPNTDPKSTADTILSIAPGGGTNMGPALVEAANQLKPAKAAIKHIIVLSDGRSIGYQELPGLAERIHTDTGASISTISVGDAADERNMADIANRGGGKSYVVTNPNLLAKFFLKAVRVIRTPQIREGAFEPVLGGVASPLTAGLDAPPRLLGFVLTQRRPEVTITYAMDAPTGEPLLAHWNVELGKVGVFTSDASRWAGPWLEWPGYRRMWTQVARSLSRAGAESPFEISVETTDDSIRIRMDAADAEGKPLDRLRVPVTVHGPGGKQVQGTLSQVGPGQYEGRIPAEETGSYIAIVKPSEEGGPLPPIIAGASVSSGVEFRRLATDRALLEQLARETRGRSLTLADSGRLFDRAGIEPREARSPLWRSLLLWTLLVLLLDVGTRRIAWDRFTSREFGVDLKKAARESVSDRGDVAAKAVTQLRAAPSRIEVEQARAASIRLSDDDAQRVAEEEQERRRQARLAAIQATRDRQKAEAAAAEGESSPTPAPLPKPSQADEAAGGLLAAKRRARERMEGMDQA